MAAGYDGIRYLRSSTPPECQHIRWTSRMLKCLSRRGPNGADPVPVQDAKLLDTPVAEFCNAVMNVYLFKLLSWLHKDHF